MSSTLQGPAAPDDIAIVGLACLFPAAPDLGTYWRNILAKVSAISSPPPEAWDADTYYDPASRENDRVYCRKGGYLGTLAYFDPLEHGIMPRAVEGGEPDQWLALRVARDALRDAGYADGVPHPDRAALILGKGNYANRGTISVVYHAVVVDYTLQLLKSVHPDLTADDLRRIRDDLRRRLPRFDAETAPALISNVAAGRIANRLDLMGPSYTIDAACASSLLAVDAAVKGLRHREYDLALVGGMQVATPAPVLSLFCQLSALSAREAIRPFDTEADGTLLSEGVGMAVLKRRSDAERDGDRVYAYVKATGVASDGRAVSVLAPRVEGEELALRHAYERGGIPPRTVGLVEAHGTATLVGDATEVEALSRVFGERDGMPHCALGSVKSMIGHTMPASGIAGLIKAALALHHKVLPPTLGVTDPSPRLKLERTPFYINTETRPWIHGNPESPRRAGVNAFGFGGINAHVVLEEASAAGQSATLDTEWDSEVCLFGGANRDEVLALGRRVAARLARDPALALADVAHSLTTETGPPATVTLGIVARTTDDLARKLERALTRLADPATRRIKDASGIYYFDEPLARAGKLAFVFPGEGAQYVNMLGDLCRHFPEVRACFDAMDRVLFDHPRGFRLSELVFPPPPFTDAERVAAEQRLWQMDVAVEAVVVANAAISTLLGRLGIVPDAILGHSSGEYSAMRAAGMVDEVHNDERILELNDQHRDAARSGELPVDTCLIAVAAGRERVEALCASIGVTACVAMDNCRHQVVLSADAATAALLEPHLQDAGLLYERLAFDRPYHTPQFEPFAETLRPLLEQWIVRPPVVPLYSCTSMAPYPSDLGAAQQLAFDHWVKPVEFRQTIETMWRDGFRIFVEAGPRGNLTAFIDDVLAGQPFAAVPANVSRRSGLLQLHHLLAHLAAHGVALTLGPLYARRRLARIDWTMEAGPSVVRRSLGRVKLPTGAPEMRLSPEIIELIASRGRGAGRASAVAEATPAASPVQTIATMPPSVSSIAADPDPAVGSSSTRDQEVDDPSVPSPGAVESAPLVMSAFLRTMDSFLALEHELMHDVFAAGPSDGTAGSTEAPTASGSDATAVASDRRWPLIQLDASVPPGRLVARCTLDLDTHPFLRDHTLGRNVSVDDPVLAGFPIVPFTALMEIMAEAATALAPHAVVTGMREVRVHRWLAVDRGPLHLEITAEWSDAGQVAVRLTERDASIAGPVADGVMLLGDSYPAPPEPAPLVLQHEGRGKWPADRLYEEAMFHGPLFRGVRSIDRVGDNGAEASLTVLERAGLAPLQAGEGFATDFVLLDQPGQVIGFWTSQYLERGFVVLPFRMGELDLYGPPLPPGERLTCRATIALTGELQVRSDLDVVRSDGRLWAQFKDWEDRRFDLPHATFRGLLDPASARLSHPWPLTDGEHETSPAMAFRIGLDSFPPGWLHAHGGLWSRVLAALTLGRRERAIWQALKVPERRRLEWLLGRIAAKDAVRDYLRRHDHLSLCPADVEILPDPSGRPTATGAWTRQLSRVPLVSISHAEGTAVAVVIDGAGISGVGIDLERIGRMKPETERVAFDAGELDILESVDADERQAWALRLWCAKEASAKATGGELRTMSQALTVERIHRERGTVVMRCGAAAAGAVTLSATTTREGDWIIGTCIAAERPTVVKELIS